MSILIKGITMPKNCHECPLFESKYHCHGCHAVPKSFYDIDMWEFVSNYRPSWCPLVPVSPHGRLIDADALMKRVSYMNTEAYMDGVCYGVHPSMEYLDLLSEIIDDAPTIIESEE